jgi:hypothetical protein
MRSRLLFAELIVVIAAISFPAAASATGYTAQGPTVQVLGTGAGVLSFTGFQPNERTTASAPAAVTLAALHAVVSLERNSDGTGRVDYSASATAPGSYTITVTGMSGTVSVGTLTVLPPDREGTDTSGHAGDSVAIILGGIAGGLVLLALAFVLVRRRTLLARQKA